jgi:hypothetical protein
MDAGYSTHELPADVLTADMVVVLWEWENSDQLWLSIATLERKKNNQITLNSIWWNVQFGCWNWSETNIGRQFQKKLEMFKLKDKPV